MSGARLKEFIWDEVTLTADAADESFDKAFSGTYLYQVEMIASLDTTVQLLLKTDQGVTFYDSTSADWTTATGSGGIPQSVATVGGFYYAAPKRITYTVVGIGSGNFWFRLVGTRSPL